MWCDRAPIFVNSTLTNCPRLHTIRAGRLERMRHSNIELRVPLPLLMRFREPFSRRRTLRNIPNRPPKTISVNGRLGFDIIRAKHARPRSYDLISPDRVPFLSYGLMFVPRPPICWVQTQLVAALMLSKISSWKKIFLSNRGRLYLILFLAGVHGAFVYSPHMYFATQH
jgi:hypothetical protein